MTPRKEWERCKPWIQDALEYCYGTHTIEDIEAGVISGLYQFWPGERCAVITEIANYPRMSVCRHFLVGGDMTELVEQMEPVISAWAKTQGCARVANCGRPGWKRVLGRIGYASGSLETWKDI